MAIKDRLYTVNPFNWSGLQNVFNQERGLQVPTVIGTPTIPQGNGSWVDRLYNERNYSLSSAASTPSTGVAATGKQSKWDILAQKDKEANPWNYADDLDTTDQYKHQKNIFGITKEMNPFSKGNIANTAAIAAPIVGQAANKIISGGYSSGAGKAIGTIGTTAGGIISNFNPMLGAGVTLASNVIGGATNALFGEKLNEGLKKSIDTQNQNMKSLANAAAGTRSQDELADIATQLYSEHVNAHNGPWKGGVWNKSADKKNERLMNKTRYLADLGERTVENSAHNIAMDQVDNALYNYSAFGGPLDMINTEDMDAINYGFLSDYLTNRRKQAEAKDKINGITAMPAGTMFAIGGDMQTNSADFSTGLTHVDAGGSHEMNPNGGVEMGVDREGTPNLLEQGETVFNDYVYSVRIELDDEAKKAFHIGKKRKITYADMSKKLEKEASERPNDPISRAALKVQMQDLAEHQERQKQEMEAARVREAFEALTPEEQAELMQYAQQREQQEAQAQMAEQPTEEEMMAAQQQMSPEDMAMMQQQQMMAQEGAGMAPQGMEEVPVQAAYGGKVNRFDNGGLKDKIYNLLKLYTDDDFKNWADKNKVGAVDWDDIYSNKAFIEALGKDNPSLRHALQNRYDFGVYTAPKIDKVTFDNDRGNWDNQTVAGWWGSEDPAWKELVSKGKVKETDDLNREQLADLIRNTDAFKRGTQWLQDSEDNRLMYLKAILDNPNAPTKARAYAQKYIDKNGWKEGAARDYETIFNNPSGRAANPGTYWKTPIELSRGKVAKNFIINEDGSVSEMAVDVPEGWKAENTYNWADNDSDYTYNYFKRPADSGAATDAVGKKKEGEGDDESDWIVTPNYKNENLRYAGLLSPAIGLGLQMMNVGRPDTAAIDAAVDLVGGSPALAHHKPIGNYIHTKPADIQFQRNMNRAQNNAVGRSILNASNGNAGTIMAGLLANGLNGQTADGNLLFEAQKYADATNRQDADFNRGTDMYNADAFNKTAMANAEMLSREKQASATARLQAAQAKMDADAGWYNGIYGNIGGFFKGLSDLGRENAQHNMIAEMAADEIFGPMSPRTNTGKRGKYLTFTKKSAKGGKINRKKGGK